jgi:hypothetical protein
MVLYLHWLQRIIKDVFSAAFRAPYDSSIFSGSYAEPCSTSHAIRVNKVRISLHSIIVESDISECKFSLCHPIDLISAFVPILWKQGGDAKMETAKIRIKIGEHEFEAEGTPESVQSQFEAFQSLISGLANKLAPREPSKPLQSIDNSEDGTRVPLGRIMRVQGRVVSLTALPTNLEDAALLIMLGNLDLRENESVTGQEIGDGLAQSGRTVPRVDRVVGPLINEAFVLKSGFKRSSRYRLSNSGHQKALAVARELIATLP